MLKASTTKTVIPIKSTHPGQPTCKAPSTSRRNAKNLTTAVNKSGVQTNTVKDKAKLDMNELDDMKKELENKRIKKEAMSPKTLYNNAGFKKKEGH